MDRRDFLKRCAAAGGGFLFSNESLELRIGARRPNIIFLLTDDQRWDAVGCAGNEIIKTPNIDALAAGGTLFENAFVTTSICMASRASIFTGQFERCHGCNFNSESLLQSSFDNSYAVLLRKAGYRTGVIGKFGFAVTEEREPSSVWKDISKLPTDQFDEWYGYAGQGNYFPEGEGGKHLTEIMGDDAVEFLSGCSGERPFCLSISFKASHKPWGDYDPAYSELYVDAPIDDDMKNYYRLVTGVDVVIGRIRRELTRRGLAEETVIIFTSDNGYMFDDGGHGTAKDLLYDASIRVPLVVYDPRAPRRLRGRRLKEMALNIDFAATMLDMAGEKIPESMQGRSLLPLLSGGEYSWRNDFFCENNFPRGDPEGRLSVAVRTDEWKYIRYYEQEPVYEELFELENDPLETVNLATDGNYQQILNSLRQRCDEWLQEAECNYEK